MPTTGILCLVFDFTRGESDKLFVCAVAYMATLRLFFDRMPMAVGLVPMELQEERTPAHRHNKQALISAGIATVDPVEGVTPTNRAAIAAHLITTLGARSENEVSFEFIDLPPWTPEIQATADKWMADNPPSKGMPAGYC